MPRVTKKTQSLSNNRVPSGIPGLDDLIGGGFVEDDVYLITGSTGTGKTIFCCQFLWEGLQRGEKCIFFSLEERIEDIIKDAAVFGWDFEKYRQNGQFVIEYKDPFEMADITTLVREKIKNFGAKRVAIDSTSIFGMVFKNEQDLRKRLYELIKAFKGTGSVVLMTAEIPEESDEKGYKTLSRYGVEEFIVDGVIVLYYIRIGEEEANNIEIRKMRRTKHAHGYFPIKFTDKGLKVEKTETSVLMK